MHRQETRALVLQRHFQVDVKSSKEPRGDKQGGCLFWTFKVSPVPLTSRRRLGQGQIALTNVVTSGRIIWHKTVQFTHMPLRHVSVPTGAYVGCFQEPKCGQELDTWALQYLGNDPGMTPTMCIGMAVAKKLAYAAVQASTYCFGGVDISSYNTPGTCSLCDGLPYTLCGGACSHVIFHSGELSLRTRLIERFVDEGGDLSDVLS